MNTSAKFKVNRTETAGRVIQTSILGQIKGNSSIILDGIFTKFAFAHLQLQTDLSGKYKVNQTEIAGGVVKTSILNVNRGNNSRILHSIFTKVACCTSSTHNEHFCQV